jgi:hypothetical protein
MMLSFDYSKKGFLAKEEKMAKGMDKGKDKGKGKSKKKNKDKKKAA